MIFYVYILINQNHRIYIGQTNCIEMRLERHNSGLVESTAPYRPWTILFTEQYQTRSEAIIREKWLKTGIGREYIKKRLSSSIGPPPAD